MKGYETIEQDILIINLLMPVLSLEKKKKLILQ